MDSFEKSTTPYEFFNGAFVSIMKYTTKKRARNIMLVDMHIPVKPRSNTSTKKRTSSKCTPDPLDKL